MHIDIDIGAYYITKYFEAPSLVRVESLESPRGPGYVLATQLPSGKRVHVARGNFVAAAEPDHKAQMARLRAARARGERWQDIAAPVSERVPQAIAALERARRGLSGDSAEARAIQAALSCLQAPTPPTGHDDHGAFDDPLACLGRAIGGITDQAAIVENLPDSPEKRRVLYVLAALDHESIEAYHRARELE